MTHPSRLGAALVLAGGLLNACQPESGEPPSEDTHHDMERILEPTLADVQAHVFDRGCAFSSCHGEKNAAADLDLSSVDASYASLVDVPAANLIAAANAWRRVVPGDSDRSFLVRKLVAPGPGEGSPMPSSETAIDPMYLDMVIDWIDQGARRDD